VLAVGACWVDHQGVLPDPGCYEERYRLTGSAALGLAAGQLALDLGLLWHTEVFIVIAVVLVAALIPQAWGGGVALDLVARRAVAFRADHEGITLGAVPDKLTRRRRATVFVPWADVEQIVLYPAYPGGRGRYAQARCIGIRRREGAPALSQGNEQAPGCPVPGVAAGATRRITGWRLDREHLATVTAAVAPGILIVDADTAASPGIEGPGQPVSTTELGPAD
jgi:hypothetical protein